MEAFPWDYEVYHPEQEPVLLAVKKFATLVLEGRSPHWLTFLGPSGIGKTHLLKQLFRCLDRLNSSGKYKLPTRDGSRGAELAHIKPADDLQDYQDAQVYSRYDFLYIEDVGAGGVGHKGAGAVVKDRLITLLQGRSNRFTALDANLTLGDIEEHLDARIASRVLRDGGVLFQFSSDIPDFWLR